MVSLINGIRLDILLLSGVAFTINYTALLKPCSRDDEEAMPLYRRSCDGHASLMTVIRFWHYFALHNWCYLFRRRLFTSVVRNARAVLFLMVLRMKNRASITMQLSPIWIKTPVSSRQYWNSNDTLSHNYLRVLPAVRGYDEGNGQSLSGWSILCIQYAYSIILVFFTPRYAPTYMYCIHLGNLVTRLSLR